MFVNTHAFIKALHPWEPKLV